MMKPYILILLLAVGACCHCQTPSTPVPIIPPVAPTNIFPDPEPRPHVKPHAIDMKNGVILQPASFDELHGWNKDNHAEALRVFNKSCKNKKKYAGVCGKNPRDAKRFLENNFVPYLVTDATSGRSAGTFTGYYEITLNGSRRKHGKYQHPIHSLPPKKYLKLSRGEVYNGGLNGVDNVILWLDSPVDAFSLHIQGSGVVHLDDGSYVRVGFAGRNAHKYRSIGQWMMRNGYVPKNGMSAEGIRQWLMGHPKQMYEIMAKNPSYIYFTEKKGANGAIGAMGLELTGQRSLAVDKRYIPLGSLLWLETKLPDYSPYQRLFVAQDTGSAIKGKTRGDIFFGLGDEAKYLASHMKQKGQYYILLPR